MLDELPKGWGRSGVIALVAVGAEAIGLRSLECVGLRWNLLHRPQNLLAVLAFAVEIRIAPAIDPYIGTDLARLGVQEKYSFPLNGLRRYLMLPRFASSDRVLKAEAPALFSALSRQSVRG